MPEKPICFYSNRVEHLYEFLKEMLFNEGSGPFTKRIVVVPSQAMKRWLMIKLAKDKNKGIFAGIQFPFLENAIQCLVNFFDLPLKAVNKQDLVFSIEIEIRKLIDNSLTLDDLEQQALLEPLLRYLELCTGHDLNCRRKEEKLVKLSHQMADLFFKYGGFGGNWISKWEEDRIRGVAGHWQQLVWNAVFTRLNGASCSQVLHQRLNLLTIKPDVQIHLFCLSFVPNLQLQFLLSVSKQIPLFFHLLSPCKSFWTDTLSEREIKGLSHTLKKKRLPIKEKEALEDYLRDTNPLLANWGRVGREYVSSLEEKDAVVFEKYVMPAGLAALPSYEDYVDDSTLKDEEQMEGSLLQAVQADILLLRNPTNSCPFSFPEKNLSIQLHASTTKMRETQDLHDALMRIVASEQHGKNPVVPSDIIVMAPRIADYVPYIRAVFESQEGIFPIQFSDLILAGQNQYVKGLKLLIGLAEKRWKVSDLMGLLENAAFGRKLSLSNDDLIQFKNWIKSANIRWGQDGEHRSELLSRQYKSGSLHFEQEEKNTWEYGFWLILKNFFSVEDETLDSYAELSLSHCTLLGKLWNVIRSIREDLQPLTDGTRLSLDSWGKYFHCLLEAYFLADSSVKEDKENYCFLENQLLELGRNQDNQEIRDDELFSFVSIQPHLMQILDQETLSYNEQHLQAVHFSSLLPMRAVPARIVCLMGMNEDRFPQSQIPCSFDLLKGNKEADYCPLKSDYDRYLFLESLLSARDYFILTYSDKSLAEGKEQPPSLLAVELLSYLDKHYLIQDQLPSSVITRKHPHQAFHWSYFCKEKPHLMSFSKTRYQEARAFYFFDEHKRLPPHRFFLDLYAEKDQLKASVEPSDEIVIDLQQLNQLSRKPLKIYFNHALNIYIPSEDAQTDQEPFFCNHLDLWQYKNAFCNGSFEKKLDLDVNRGKLPPGHWKDATISYIKKEIDQLKLNIKKMGLNDTGINQLEFSSRCRKAYVHSKTHWVFPAPEFSIGKAKIKISGVLTGVVSEGLLISAKNDFKGLSRALPAFLLLHYVPEECSILSQKKLFLCEDAKVVNSLPNYDETMRLLILYYLSCQNRPCALLPEWIPYVMSGNAMNLQKQMKKSFSNSFGGTQDDYVRWSLNPEDLPDAELLINEWRETFSKLYEGTVLSKMEKKK